MFCSTSTIVTPGLRDGLQHLVELELRDRGQAGARLVDEDQRRLVDERAADRQRRLLAAGHRAGQLVARSRSTGKRAKTLSSAAA
jgi:hypothetical protein